MYPLKFKKYLVKKVWGGREFQEKLKIKLPDDGLYGESWEVSCHKNGMSYVENGEYKGESLEDLIIKYREKLIGKDNYRKYKEKFPLLIKYLDINDKLSVQVHPDDTYALKVEGEFGKSETWYVLDATEDATIILGLKKGNTKESFLEKINEKKFEEIFNIVKIKKGDFINITPGIVHGTLTGSILICETQQNSDTTYRIYDYDRVVDGEKRELHLTKGLEVIDFEVEPKIINEDFFERNELHGAKLIKLIKGDYFSIDKLEIKGKYKDEIMDGFKVYSIIDGNGFLVSENKRYVAEKGDTYFIPAGVSIEIQGELEILKSYI